MADGGRRLAVPPDRPDRPLDLSIVIPCHDDGAFLPEAVESAERSAPESAELVVVNDGSRDERTLAELAALRRAGYRVIDQGNAGLAAARNRGIAASRGRYLLPLDADNRLLPGFAAAAIGVLESDPAVGIVYGDRVEFGERSGRVQVPEFDLDSLLRANFIDACAVLRREVWEGCGGYDGAMPAMGWEDWDLWLAAAERGWAFHRLPAPTFDYRVRPGSMASRLHTAEVGVPLRLYMFDKHRELYRRRLPQLLTAQHLAAGAEAENARLAAEREGLVAERAELRAERERLRADLAVRAAERDRLLAELADWRRHVEFMEGTRAWRLRDVLLRLRGKK
jgi:glycosyltransferase involved in cell wall biosynthesis